MNVQSDSEEISSKKKTLMFLTLWQWFAKLGVTRIISGFDLEHREHDNHLHLHHNLHVHLHHKHFHLHMHHNHLHLQHQIVQYTSIS